VLELKLKEIRKAKQRQKNSPFKKANRFLHKKLSFLKWLDPFTYADILLERSGKKDKKIVSWSVYLLTAALSAFVLYNFFALLLGTRFPGVIVLSGSMEPLFYRGDIIIMQGFNVESLHGARIKFDGSIKGLPLSNYATTYCSRNDGTEIKTCSKFKEDYRNGKVHLPDFSTTKIVFSNGKEVKITKNGDIVVYYGYVFNWLTGTHSFEPIIHRVVAIIEANDGVFVLTKGDSKFNSFIDQDAGISPSAVPVSELEGRLVAIIPKLGYVKLLVMDDLPCVLMSLIDGRYCVLP